MGSAVTRDTGSSTENVNDFVNESNNKSNKEQSKNDSKNENISYNNNKSKIERSVIQDTRTQNEQRLILIGSTGSGKSATGNTILQKYVFESLFSPKPITKQNAMHSNNTIDTKVVVVDTPGIRVSYLQNEDYRREVKESLGNAITLVQPGPHAFLLVVSIPRFSELDVQLVKFLKHHMKSIIDHMIIIFTGSDFLYAHNKQLSAFKEELPLEFKDFIQYQCDNRVMLFTNTIKTKAGDNTKDHNGQVTKLLQKVKDMTKSSGITQHRKLAVIQQDKTPAESTQVPYLKTGLYKSNDRPIPGTEFLHSEHWRRKY